MLIDEFFQERLISLSYDDNVKAYIASICKQFLSVKHDLSDQSLTLLFFKASETSNFSLFQNIADYTFWLAVFKHQAFVQHKHVYEMVARSSYQTCYHLLKKQWPIFEQLSEEFHEITTETRKKIVLHTVLNLKN